MAVSAVDGKTRMKTSTNDTYMNYATWSETETEIVRHSVEYHEVVRHCHQGLRTPILAASTRSCRASNE